ncbi:OmpA family protein [Roseivivax sp. THAF30]|uniref:OmpA family protein n=1 Tax=Roseivivax sp. THAF30 TaxID=2587852 RepID=UPI0012A816AB|nr:OmpA family protein [Roseivivax sp. THAF30]QFT64152.1 Outer membrane lipoprotein Omp16 precursor [Roseivivax sp. THAF30]
MRGFPNRHKRRAAACALLASASILTACAREAGTSPNATYFHREAGSVLGTGDFGAATKNNVAVMSGEKRYTFDLANRFASEVMTTVNFAFNSSVLDEGARDTLREQAAWIRQFPELSFRVYGHTDLVGNDAYNKRLGLARAQAVVHFLASQGVNLGRLEAVVSYGETQPLIVTQGRERRNRRTVTEVSGFVQSHQNVLDGKYAQIVYREYVNSASPSSSLGGGGGDGGLGAGGGGE